MHGDRIKGNRHKFLLGIRKQFSLLRTIKHWNKLLREVVECPSLEVVKTWLETAMDYLI